MKVEVAAGTPISVYTFIFFAEFALIIFPVSPWRKENKRMDWVQGMVQPKR